MYSLAWSFTHHRLPWLQKRKNKTNQKKKKNAGTDAKTWFKQNYIEIITSCTIIHIWHCCICICYSSFFFFLFSFLFLKGIGWQRRRRKGKRRNNARLVGFWFNFVLVCIATNLFVRAYKPLCIYTYIFIYVSLFKCYTIQRQHSVALSHSLNVMVFVAARNTVCV